MIIDLLTKNSFLEQTLTQELYEKIDNTMAFTIKKKYEAKELIDLQNWCNLLEKHFNIKLTSNEIFLYIMKHSCLHNYNVKIDISNIILEKGDH